MGLNVLPTRPLETALHVRVAEALGWFQIGPGNSMNMGDPGIGYPPVNAILGHKEPIPRFDTDWSATGPLIEKYMINISAPECCIGCESKSKEIPGHANWLAESNDWDEQAEGLTPLIAVCHLILALKEAGKL